MGSLGCVWQPLTYCERRDFLLSFVARLEQCYRIALRPASRPEANSLALATAGVTRHSLEEAYEAFYDVYCAWLKGDGGLFGTQIGGYARPLQDSVYADAIGLVANCRNPYAVQVDRGEARRWACVVGGFVQEYSYREPEKAFAFGLAETYALIPFEAESESRVDLDRAQVVMQST